MGVFLALLILSVSLLILLFHYKRTYWLRRSVPHNKPVFPMGDLNEWRKTKTLNGIFAPIYQKFKGTAPFAGMYFLVRPVALILDIDLVKNILIKDFTNFQDRGLFYNEKDDPLTGHLFFLDGSKWRNLRHKLSPTFTSGKMKFMYPTMIAVADEFIKVLAEKQMSAPDGVIEISDLLARFTADVIGSCAFGLDCNSLRNPNAEFVIMGRRAIMERRHTKLIDSIMESAPKLARALHLCKLPTDVHNFYMSIIRDTIEYREKHNVKRNDFMNILIEMKEKEEKDGGLTVSEIAAQAFVFLLAGFETSSAAMGFALYELAKHQDIQNRLRKEIVDVLERYNNKFSYEAMQDMKYLEQVLSETLRKYPILGHLVRQTKSNYKTSNPHYIIGKGVTVIIPIYSIHYDPQYYPDPKKFDPERFTEEEMKKRPACSWLPFGDGPRNCIGLRFGKMQSFVGLAYLLKNFKFTTCEQTDMNLTYVTKNVLLQSANGIKLKIRRL